jgi:Mg/Co/Ni transporter MgtE
LGARAACRLATLGFDEVYDYTLGKVDWIARGLPVEGSWNQAATAGALARMDAATCRLSDSAAVVRERIEASPYGFALVLDDETGILLGRVRRSALGDDAEAAVGELMEPGPSTVRAHVKAKDLARQLRERDLTTALVSTPGGRLLGVVRRDQLGSE